jgi:hypothetical protein
VNVAAGGEAAERWAAAGRPSVPALLVDGEAATVLHVSQVARLVGLEAPPGVDAVRYAWETLSLLRGWISHLEAVDERVLGELVSAGRTFTFLGLAVNVFNPFGLLPAAWETGEFDWRPERDVERAEELGPREGVLAFCRRIYGDWADFLLAREDELAAGDRDVSSSRGAVTYGQLLETQRWHAAVHYRQMVHSLRERGIAVPGAFELESLSDLELPASIF